MVGRPLAYGAAADMAEFDLIRKIRDAVGVPGHGTIVGLGDDAAVFEPSPQLELLTCDAFVEQLHFRREFATFREIGAKCMVANVSDIAAMAGLPTRAVLSVCVPGSVSDDDVMEIYRGALDVCSRYGAEIVGGDTVGSPSGLMISVALLGTVRREQVITRSGAVVGDAVLVTGSLGGSQAGLLSLERRLPDDPQTVQAKLRHRAPVARVAEARALIEVATPHAMIDVSDGLSSDALHIAEESGVGIMLEVEKVPYHPCLQEVAERLGAEPLDLALASGEEFELVVTLSEAEVERAAEHVMAVTGTPVTRIGQVVDAGEGCGILMGDGSRRRLARSGYEHLKGGMGGNE